MSKKRKRRGKKKTSVHDAQPTQREQAVNKKDQLSTSGRREVSIRPVAADMRMLFRDSALPEKMQKRIARIAKKLHGYEGFIASVPEGDVEAFQDALETVVALDIYDDELKEDVQRLARDLGQWCIAISDRAAQSRAVAFENRAEEQNREYSAREIERIEQQMDRARDAAGKKYNKTVNRMIQQCLGAHRPLLTHIIDEAVMAASNVQLRDIIQNNVRDALTSSSFGTDRAIEDRSRHVMAALADIRKTLDPEQQSPQLLASFDWNQLAYYFNSRSVQIEEDDHTSLRHDAIHQWLLSVDFESSDIAEEFEFEGIKIDGNRLRGKLFTPENRHPFVIAGFEISIDGVNEGRALCAGEVSRLTNELTVHGMYFSSIDEIFKDIGAEKAYAALRFEIIRAIYRKYEREQVPVSDRQGLRELLSENPEALRQVETQTGAVHVEQFEEDYTSQQISVSNTDGDDSHHVLDTQSQPDNLSENENTVHQRSVADQVAQINAHLERDKKERRIERPPRISVKNVKARLFRLKARIITGEGGHNKFVGPTGVPLPFYNDHASQRGRMLFSSKVEEYIQQLGFSVEDFWRA